MSTSNKRRYISGISTGFWILIIPFFLYFHKAFGDNEVFEVFGFTINHGFGHNETFAWYVLTKIVAVLLLLTWFVTTGYKWKYFILAPLMVYTYSLIKALNFIPVIVANNALFAKIMTMVILGLLAIFDYHYYQKPRAIKFRAKDTGLNKEFYEKTQTRKTQIRKLEKQLPPKSYFYELYKSKELLAPIFQKSKSTSKSKSNRRIIFDTVICTLLLLIVPIYYTFELVPVEVQTYNLFGLIIGSHGFHDVSWFVWYTCNKICIIIPLCIWFVTCEHWWRHGILSPIILFTYQLWSAYQNVTSEIDNYEYVRAMPTILILLVALTYISKKVKYKVRILEYYENLSHEIEDLLKKINTEESDKIKAKYGFGIIGDKNISNKKPTSYIKNLNKMKKELLNQLDQSY
jgi:hypothetical protein